MATLAAQRLKLFFSLVFILWAGPQVPLDFAFDLPQPRATLRKLETRRGPASYKWHRRLSPSCLINSATTLPTCASELNAKDKIRVYRAA